MKKQCPPQDKSTQNHKNILTTLIPGLLYTHTRINDNTKKVLESSSFLYALVDLLDKKGIITIKELDEKKKEVAERLVQKFVESGIGLMYQDPECDKYAFEHGKDGDCESRLHLCNALCCKIPFALSRQDVEERIIRWEFGRPYVIAHDPDGYCVHLDKKSLRCTEYEHRPVPCRGFDCRDNEKWQIWLDYDKKIINTDLNKRIEETNSKFYSLPGF